MQKSGGKAQSVEEFANALLLQEAHVGPDLWSIITGLMADRYLATRWSLAAGNGASATAPGPKWLPLIETPNVEARVMELPEQVSTGGLYYIAFVRVRGQHFPLHYFVCEKQGTGAFWSEFKSNGDRARGSDLKRWPADHEQRRLYPQPFLGSFIQAIDGNLAGQARPDLPGPPPAPSNAPPQQTSLLLAPEQSSGGLLWIVLFILGVVVAGGLAYFFL